MTRYLHFEKTTNMLYCTAEKAESMLMINKTIAATSIFIIFQTQNILHVSSEGFDEDRHCRFNQSVIQHLRDKV